MRGRSIVFLALLGFVLVATGVIWRRSTGIAMSRELRVLETRRTALEAQPITASGAEISRPEFVSAEADLMDDGETYFDTLRFRMFVQAA